MVGSFIHNIFFRWQEKNMGAVLLKAIMSVMHFSKQKNGLSEVNIFPITSTNDK